MRFALTGYLITLISLPALVGAQTKDVAGYYRTLQGDTIRGVLTIPTRYSASEPVEHLLHWRVYYKPDSGSPGHILQPPQIAAFGFELKEQPFDFISVPNVQYLANPFGEPEERIFLRTLVHGPPALLSRPIRRYYGGDVAHRRQERAAYPAFPEIHYEYFLFVNGEIIDLNGERWREYLKRFLDSQTNDAVDRMKRKDIPAMVVAHVRKRPAG